MATVAPPPERNFDPWSVGLLALYPIELAGVVVIDAVGDFVAGLASNVPLVGGPLGNLIRGGLAAWRGWLFGSMSNSLVGYNDLVAWAQTLWVGFYYGAIEWADATAGAATRIATVLIPSAVGQGIGYAEALAGAAEQRADGFASGIEASLRGLIAAGAADTAALVSGARSEAVGLFQSAEADALALEQKAVAVAVAVADQARADALTATAALGSDLAAARTGLENEIAAVGQASQQGLSSLGGAVAQGAAGLGELDQKLTQARTELGGKLDQFEQVLGQEVGAILASPGWTFLGQLIGLGELLTGQAETALFDAVESEVKSQIEMGQVIVSKSRPLIRGIVAGLESRL